MGGSRAYVALRDHLGGLPRRSQPAGVPGVPRPVLPRRLRRRAGRTPGRHRRDGRGVSRATRSSRRSGSARTRTATASTRSACEAAGTPPAGTPSSTMTGSPPRSCSPAPTRRRAGWVRRSGPASTRSRPAAPPICWPARRPTTGGRPTCAARAPSGGPGSSSPPSWATSTGRSPRSGGPTPTGSPAASSSLPAGKATSRTPATGTTRCGRCARSCSSRSTAIPALHRTRTTARYGAG